MYWCNVHIKVTIEKDGGCNHMTCKNTACRSEFCWMCLGPWEPHGSSWYSCNRFDDSQAKQVSNFFIIQLIFSPVFGIHDILRREMPKNTHELPFRDTYIITIVSWIINSHLDWRISSTLRSKLVTMSPSAWKTCEIIGQNGCDAEELYELDRSAILEKGCGYLVGVQVEQANQLTLVDSKGLVEMPADNGKNPSCQSFIII